MMKQTSWLYRGFSTRTLLATAGTAMACGCGAAESVPEASDTDQSAVRKTTPDEAPTNIITVEDDLSPESRVKPTGPIVDAATASITAKLLTVNGSGCPAGSATLQPIPSANAFTITFQGYSAARGENLAAAETRRNCLFLLEVKAPTGYTYTPTSASLSGDANLLPGSTGQAVVSYYFPGSPGTAVHSHSVAAGAGQWNTAGAFPSESLIYAPCGAAALLAINTSVAIPGESDSPAQSTLSLDPSSTVQFQLRECQ
ncbi:MAG TPA: DUF4360 domain-containing protein [Polyangiaceae bacterium]|nr:DUF4360 domain-containing protein [Polyangiaceae bacterium]